jgi:glucose/arabinose dehydrogenase
MRMFVIVLVVALVAAACAGSPPTSAPMGAGTTAPVDTEEPVSTPPSVRPVLRLELVTDHLAEPVALALRPGDDRIYVAERMGRVVVVDRGIVSDFLDLTDVVYQEISEQGLLGLTFDTVGDRLFVLYTDRAGDVRVFGYDVDGDAVDPGSATSILTVRQVGRYHQGGGMAFGPDGYLWIGLGDGGGEGDPQGEGQNTDSVLASIVRLDVDSASPYAIPPDNPFVDTAAPELWAYGLRNPWRFAFDAGLVYIADVGQNEREEIDVVPLDAAGSNFGWSIREGDVCFGAATCPKEGMVDPVLAIPHQRLCAIIGGPVYRGSSIPALEGQYFYGDYCVGWIRSLLYDGGEVVATYDWERDLGDPGHITTFGEDALGEILVATEEGELYRIVAEP